MFSSAISAHVSARNYLNMTDEFLQNILHDQKTEK